MEEKDWCQSCSMPLTKEEELGTNKDGSKNKEYCIYCYKDGEYTDKEITMEGMVEMCVPIMVENGMQEDEARKIMNNALPTLKRWKQN